MYKQTGHGFRDEIAGDVLELWIGISRLMARVQEPDPEPGPDSPAPGSALRRKQRRAA